VDEALALVAPGGCHLADDLLPLPSLDTGPPGEPVLPL
jgi:hypothetical protein